MDNNTFNIDTRLGEYTASSSYVSTSTNVADLVDKIHVDLDNIIKIDNINSERVLHQVSMMLSAISTNNLTYMNQFNVIKCNISDILDGITACNVTIEQTENRINESLTKNIRGRVILSRLNMMYNIIHEANSYSTFRFFNKIFRWIDIPRVAKIMHSIKDDETELYDSVANTVTLFDKPDDVSSFDTYDKGSGEPVSFIDYTTGNNTKFNNK